MRFFKRIVLSVICFIPYVLMAQPTGGGPGGGGDPDAPIDGALGLLIASGALLGLRKLRQNNKRGD